MYSVTFLKRKLRTGQTYYEIKDMIEKIDIKDASIAEEVRKQMSVVGKRDYTMEFCCYFLPIQ